MKGEFWAGWWFGLAFAFTILLVGILLSADVIRRDLDKFSAEPCLASQTK